MKFGCCSRLTVVQPLGPSHRCWSTAHARRERAAVGRVTMSITAEASESSLYAPPHERRDPLVSPTHFRATNRH